MEREGDGTVRGGGPRAAAALSRERIAAMALTLLDDESLEAFSMRRLARRLGVGVMSLYRYYASKDELFSELAREIFGAPPPAPTPGETWRERLVGLAASFRSLLLAHPNALPLLFKHGGVPLRGRPAIEAMLDALHDAGLSEPAAADAWRAIGAYLVGYVTVERMVRSGSSVDAPPPPERDFPALARIAPFLKDSWDAQFVASLKVVLDGVARLAEAGPCEPPLRASGTKGARSAR
ncbi:MAG: TetR/AcrR family transcriptional regulator C-terminal domain-containing protein [Actinomycetota bacterium]|nr:TetR/AcrR family transcriptional regulator C-terminal domain-containing protein [Actinomycetota bacterium]